MTVRDEHRAARSGLITIIDKELFLYIVLNQFYNET